MNERILKWLYDIKNAIAEIEGYFDQFPRDFNQYQSNTILKRAVERDLEIIGEAVNKILKRRQRFSHRKCKANRWLKESDYTCLR